MENNSEELKRILYNCYFDYVEKGKGACFYGQHVIQYINGVEAIMESQQKEIERLKFVVSKFNGVNIGINQSVTNLNKPIGFNNENIYKPYEK